MTRTLIQLFLLALAALVVAPVRADTRIAIQEFYGHDGRALRDEVEALYRRQEGLTIVPQAEIERLARELGVDPASPTGRKLLARELQLTAWLTGVIGGHGHRKKLTVVVYDGAEHVRVGRAVLEGRSTRKLKSAVRHELWDKSKDALFLAVAPLPAGRGAIADNRGRLTTSAASPAILAASSQALREPGELPMAAVTHDDGTEPGSLRREDEVARVSLGIGTPYRSLAYSDALSPALGDAQLAGVAMVDMSLSYYPARSYTRGVASYFGVEAAAQLALGASSTDRAGNAYTSRYNAFRLGLRGRLPLGRHFVSLFSGYAGSRLTVTPESRGIEPPTPNVDYRMIRSGAGAELALSDAISLGLDAAWLHMLSVGEVGTWFPRATAAGVEVALVATYALTRRLFARVAGTYQRTFFDFNARPGDERVAGGATDQYLTMSAGMGVSL